MKALISKFRRNETGATAIEYGMIAAMMTIAIVGAFPTITSALSEAFGYISSNLKID